MNGQVGGRPPHGTGLTPCGRTRREFLWEPAGGFVGTASSQPCWRRMGSLRVRPRLPGRHQPTELRTGPQGAAFPGQGQGVHLPVHVRRPVSQVDTFDPKPELTKHDGKPMPRARQSTRSKVASRGTLLGSPRTVQPARRSGIEVSDLFPHLGRCVDDLAVIRSHATPTASTTARRCSR